MDKNEELEKILDEFDNKTEKSTADDLYHYDSQRNIEEESDYYDEKEPKNGGSKNKIVLIVAAVIIVIAAVACGVYFALSGSGEKEPETSSSSTTENTTALPAVIQNPLTGESGYNKAAYGKRPISVVVDNASGARPQYNMSAADIVVEGEVEGGETRMLWFFADFTNLPDQIGPTRSARPSFVEFSQFYDSIYIHHGGSHSKGNYVGGYEVIKNNNVDDIDAMSFGSCFRRTKDKVSPHNSALIGDSVAAAIDKKNYRTDINENSFTVMNFNESTQPVSDIPCSSVQVKISSRTRTVSLAYNSEKKVYTNQSDYKAPVEFANVIVLFANSTYIDKENYQNSGKTETYLNYSFTSGSGKLISCGTVVDFDWSVTGGRILFKDKNGNELKFNPGKSWIALASSNHDGKATIA